MQHETVAEPEISAAEAIVAEEEPSTMESIAENFNERAINDLEEEIPKEDAPEAKEGNTTSDSLAPSKDDAPAETERVAPSFLVELKDSQVVEGERAKLEAKVSGNPWPKFTWLKDDKEMQLDDRVRAYEDGEWVILEIADAELEDEADYTCIAENEAGEAETFAELLVDGTSISFSNINVRAANRRSVIELISSCFERGPKRKNLFGCERERKFIKGRHFKFSREKMFRLLYSPDPSYVLICLFEYTTNRG